MKLELTANDPDCRQAAGEYLDELIAAGLAITWKSATNGQEGLAVEWGTSASDPPDDWEDDDPDARENDHGFDRMVEHYLQNVQLLARDSDAARSWLAGRSPRKRKPK
jgi:hypothetical protein